MFKIKFEFAIGRKRDEVTGDKYQEKLRQERIAGELFLIRHEEAIECFKRFQSEVEALIQRRVDTLRRDPRIGNIISVMGLDDEVDEIHVGRIGDSDLLVFAFDSLYGQLKIAYNGSMLYERTVKVGMNNLPAIVNEAIDALLGVL